MKKANYELALEEIVLSSERFIVMTAENRAAIRNLPAKLGNRFLDFGIAEQTLVGAAAGLALRGRIPIAHGIATFLVMRAFEFIRTDIGVAQLPVKLIGGFPGFLSEANGPTHQAIEDISLMRGIPGMGIFCPADEHDLAIGLATILESPQPFYIRHGSMDFGYRHDEHFKIGKAEIISRGTDVSICVYGILFNEALSAMEKLEKQGISMSLLNLRTVQPIDVDAILGEIQKTKLFITLKDHFLIGGLFSIVSELMTHHRLITNIYPLALENRWFKPALLKDILEYEGFTGEKIAQKILNKLDDL